MGTSKTWVPTNFEALGTPSERYPVTDYERGSDTLLVNTTLSIPDFPLGIIRGQADFQNALGLGRNSTLLDALVSAGAIFSKTFSIFQGWTGAQTQYQTDGSLVIGGYDSAKITGNNITLPFTVEDSCVSGLVISVTDINMNLKNGSNVSIIGESRGSALRACIEPTFSPISLSEDIWWAFTNVTEVAEIGRSISPINFWGVAIPADGAYAKFLIYSVIEIADIDPRYEGDLTFSVYPGLDIRIPNHQLVVPDVVINPEGQTYAPNSSIAEVLILSLQAINVNDMPLFGLPFLSSAYLIVDNDKQQFTLSQSQKSSISNLVAIDPPACSIPAPSPTSQPLASVLASSAPTSTPTPQPSSGIPKGTIAGAVVGGLAITFISAGLFLFQKRRRVEKQKQELGTMVEVDNLGHIKPELSSEG